MKNLFTMYRAEPLHNRVLYALYVVIVVFLAFVIPKDANAQAGNVYAHPQAQAAGDTFEGVVLQISLKEVEPSNHARIAGAAVGSAFGLLLASKSGSHNRFAVNTAGAVLGGLLGERATHAIAKNSAQEIIVQLAPARGLQPKIITIVQPAPFDTVYAGEMVYITIVKGAYRVLRRSPAGARSTL